MARLLLVPCRRHRDMAFALLLLLNLALSWTPHGGALGRRGRASAPPQTAATAMWDDGADILPAAAVDHPVLGRVARAARAAVTGPLVDGESSFWVRSPERHEFRASVRGLRFDHAPGDGRFEVSRDDVAHTDLVSQPLRRNCHGATAASRRSRHLVMMCRIRGSGSLKQLECHRKGRRRRFRGAVGGGGRRRPRRGHWRRRAARAPLRRAPLGPARAPLPRERVPGRPGRVVGRQGEEY